MNLSTSFREVPSSVEISPAWLKHIVYIYIYTICIYIYIYIYIYTIYVYIYIYTICIYIYIYIQYMYIYIYNMYIYIYIYIYNICIYIYIYTICIYIYIYIYIYIWEINCPKIDLRSFNFSFYSFAFIGQSALTRAFLKYLWNFAKYICLVAKNMDDQKSK